MIVRGIFAGISAQQIMLRALAGMFAAMVLGAVVGWVACVLVRDNLPAAPDSETPLPSKSDDSPTTIKTAS
jgi:hypothetical protein